MYITFCGQKIEEYAPERMTSDMGWFSTVKDIAEGQFENLSRVIEVSSGRDVSQMMVRAAANIWANKGEPLSRWQRQLLELHLGVSFANQFRMEPAE